MEQQSTVAAKQKSRNSIKIIFYTCITAGTLDILSAIVDSSIRFKITPVQLFQYIASGVFGPAAFSGGLATAAAGLLFHYFIASCWTVLFFLVYPRLKVSPKYKILSGLLYGVFIWLVMNLVVVPLSNAHIPRFSWGHVIMSMLYIMIMIGLPISFIYHRYYIRSNKKIWR